MDRTWPNVLTREGVRGHEYQVTRYRRLLQPDHDVILPFTRYVAGPGDYTQPFSLSKSCRATHGAMSWHKLSSLPLRSCASEAIHKAIWTTLRADVLTSISPVWDETRVLPGSEPGKLVVEARRSGNQWFIAAFNGADATSLDLPLDFLGKGTWKATQVRDTKDRPDALDRQDSDLTGRDHIRVDLSPRGGFVGWIAKRGKRYCRGERSKATGEALRFRIDAFDARTAWSTETELANPNARL